MASCSLRIAVFVAVLCGRIVFAQEVGSAEGARVIAGMQRDASLSEAQWNAAKKLAVINLPLGAKQSNGSDGLNIDKLTEGQIGKMDYWDFHVLSVVDAKNTLLQLGTSRTFWLEDFPSKDLVDGQAVRLIGPVEIRGTKEYTTAIGGSRTVRALRFVPADRVRQWEKDAAESQAKEDAQYRTWHSKAGTSVVAKFVAWKSGKIQLETKDGRKLSVDISAFTKEDADALRELNRELRSKK